MSFDISLPFVRDVYRLVGRGELGECERSLVDLISAHPHTPIHAVLDHGFHSFLPEYSAWLFQCCSSLRGSEPTTAILTTMGEFEVNFFDDWEARALLCAARLNPRVPDSWDCTFVSRFIGEPFHFRGQQRLRDAFEYAFNDEDPATIPSEVYTAACYLIFLRFLLLNWETHELAKEKGLQLGQIHLFCDYGDLLYHSNPGNAT